MATTNYPASLDAYPVPNNGDTISVSDHWLGPAVIGIEAELGTDPAGSHTNVKDRLDQVDSAMGFKNRIIGGNFSTNPWQRGTSFTGPTGAYTADRFDIVESSGGVVDVLKTADAPTVAEAGVFTQHCLHVDVTTADATVAAGDIVIVRQKIEGYNLIDLGFGQSGTRYFTFSFWHKHTKAGTYSVSFRNSGASRCNVVEYTQSVSDTWEKAELTIPVDTSGTWLYDNGLGLEILFALHVGSTFQTGTLSSWQAGNYIASTNQVNALDSTSNNFKIALVQLESGDKATRFETRSVGQELELCLRYYNRIATGNNKSLGMGTAYTTNNLYLLDHAPVPMRAVPTIDQSSGTNHFQYYSNNATFAFNSFTGVNAASTEKTYSIYYTGSGFTGGSSGLIRTNNSSAYFGLAAEL